ncbi:MAG: putative secreted protein [Pseudonocardia sp.]|nr:putative secreted protein [Pseudonocardia sp.]
MLAIVGLVFGLVPLTGFIALICGSIGIVFGFLGIARASRAVATNRGMSITGTALSAVALLLGIWGMTITFQAAEKLGKDLGAHGSTSQSRVATPEVSTPAPVPGQIGGDGTYVVGTDIQAGSYRTTGPARSVIPNCYWTRNSDTSGELSSIIASDITQGPTTVTIKPTDGAFHTSGCQPWTKVN